MPEASIARGPRPQRCFAAFSNELSSRSMSLMLARLQVVLAGGHSLESDGP